MQFYGGNASWRNVMSNEAAAPFYATDISVRIRWKRESSYEAYARRRAWGLLSVYAGLGFKATRVWISRASKNPACGELHHNAEEEKRSTGTTIPRRDQPRFYPLGQRPTPGRRRNLFRISKRAAAKTWRTWNSGALAFIPSGARAR